MPYGLKNRNGMWYSHIRIPGSTKIHRKALSVDLAEAKKLRDQVLADLAELHPASAVAREGLSMTFALFQKNLLEHYQEQARSTRDIMALSLRKLAEAVLVKTLGDITPAALEALRSHWIKTGYVKRQTTGQVGGENVSSCNRVIRALITAMRWAEDTYDLPPQNWRKVTRGKWTENNQRTLRYTKEQHRMIFAATDSDPVMRTLYMLAYHAGLRCGELRHLWREDIDLGARLIYIRKKFWDENGKTLYWSPKGSNAKRQMTRSVPINDELHDYLTTRLADIPGRWVLSETAAMAWHEDTMAHYWSRLLDRSGVKVGSIHTLRHCYASDLVSQGEPLENVQHFLGHSSIVTTQSIYVHFAPKVSVAGNALHRAGA